MRWAKLAPDAEAETSTTLCRHLVFSQSGLEAACACPPSWVRPQKLQKSNGRLSSAEYNRFDPRCVENAIESDAPLRQSSFPRQAGRHCHNSPGPAGGFSRCQAPAGICCRAFSGPILGTPEVYLTLVGDGRDTRANHQGTLQNLLSHISTPSAAFTIDKQNK